MPKKWNASIQAAFAARRDNFCIALGELEYDDPFSALLFYNGRLPQPWGRIDVEREVNAITLAGHGDESDPIYAALTNEGEVVVDHRSVAWEEIDGSGVLRGGRGALYALASVHGRLIAAGDGNQIYRREAEDRWTLLPTGTTSQQGYRKPGYAAIAAVKADSAYFVGSVFDDNAAYDVTQDAQYSDEMSENELAELFLQNMQSSSTVLPKGIGVFFNRTSFEDLSLSSYPALTDIHVVSEEEVWIAGHGGTLLKGNHSRGFKNQAFHVDEDANLLSVTKFGNTIFAASDRSLYEFDGHVLKTVKPKFGISKLAQVPSPLKLQTVEDVMFYFDRKHGVHLWNGSGWSEIAIPQPLLEREFKGLREL